MKTLFTVLAISISAAAPAHALIAKCQSLSQDEVKLNIADAVTVVESPDLFSAGPRTLRLQARLPNAQYVFAGEMTRNELINSLILSLPANLNSLQPGDTFSAPFIERYSPVNAPGSGSAHDWKLQCSVISRR